ncbi:MAG: NAD-dependent epimerase/dehydratase family protein [Patescibacteria group bacterium]|mgnify:CR=1 FL=1
MKTTVLVTGCAGFIGSNFVRQCRAQFPEITVVGIDDLSTGHRNEVDPSIIFYEGSMLDAELVERIFVTHKPEYVFHFAALPRVSFSVEFPRRTTEANVVGTVAMLEAAKNHGVKCFVYSSSSSVYGGADKLPTREDENPSNPKSPYAAQKYMGELNCKIFSELYGMDTVCLRYFTVFGPGQYGDSPYSTVVAAWLESLYFPNNKVGFVEGDGEQSRDFCYIDNVVQANLLAMQATRRFDGMMMNIAYGSQTSVNQLRAQVELLTGKTLHLEQRPPRIGDARHTFADISRAREMLGYDPQVDVAEGLKRTVAWFEERKHAA